MIYEKLCESAQKKKKWFALLIDPDKPTEKEISELISKANNAGVDLILAGGSLLMTDLNHTLIKIKELSPIPIILFPGSLLQISDKADGILLLSLISGRNPEFLIGNHVVAAPFLKKSRLEIIPTGYILFHCGAYTSVSYMSNTMGIPYDKTDIAVATAMAGEMTGKKLIYLEAGSGAQYPVKIETIKAVKENISIPLVVGGGIKTELQIHEVCEAGADMVVIGTAMENNSNSLNAFSQIIHSY